MLDQLERAIVRKLQEDLRLTAQPYQAIAEELGMTEEELLDKIQKMSDQGILRRLGAIVHHRKAGYCANAMVVWVVPEERAEEVGRKMASFDQVSHCYKRPPAPGWPYNMFTMVHAKTEQECESVAAKVAEAVGIYEYALLYSSVEMKKSSMKYFLED